MRPISSYLGRVAALSVLAAFATTYVVLWIGDGLLFARFEASLPPALQAEMLQPDDSAMSAELAAALSQDIDSPAYKVLNALAVMAGIVVGVGVGVVHSRRLMRPLDALATAAARLAQGDASTRAAPEPSRIAEIDAFVTNFNTMAASVERAERELRETNAAIAHELRTPITVLTGRLNGMLDGVFPTDAGALEALLTQTGQLNRIVEDLNLITLSQAGKFRVETQPVDLARLAREVLGRRAAPGLEADLAPAPAIADAARVRQMLTALLDNARRYGLPEGADPADAAALDGVRVSTGLTPDGAVLRVEDRGPGLTPGQAARVFERFWRAEKSRAKVSGGAGLGLAVTRALAEAQGGRVTYAPRDGGGAAFTIVLPADV